MINTRSNTANLMTLTDIESVAPILFTARNSKGCLLPVHLEGPPGMGKTMMAKHIARKEAKRLALHHGRPVGFGYGAHNISNSTPADIAGFVLFDSRERILPDGVVAKDKVSAYTVPTLFGFSEVIFYIAETDSYESSVVDDYGRPIYVGSTVRGEAVVHGLILLDEFAQSDADNKKASSPLLDERRIGPHFLPPGVAVWAASNRSVDKSGTTKAMAFLTNRVCVVGIMRDLDAMEAFMNGTPNAHVQDILPLAPLDAVTGRANGRIAWHPVMSTFVRQNSDMIFAGVPADPGQSFATPRSVHAVANLFDAMMVDENDEPIRFEDDSDRCRIFYALAAGLMGEVASEQLATTVALFEEIPSIAEIIADPKGVKVSDKKDAQIVASYLCSNAMSLKNGEALCGFLRRLDDVFARNALINAAIRDPALYILPAIYAVFERDPVALAHIVNARARLKQGGTQPTQRRR